MYSDAPSQYNMTRLRRHLLQELGQDFDQNGGVRSRNGRMGRKNDPAKRKERRKMERAEKSKRAGKGGRDL